MTEYTRESNKKMTDNEKNRLEDFKKVLTYHILSKIKYEFHKSSNPVEDYYNAPKIWKIWKDKKCAYNHKIYNTIVSFNNTALSKLQVRNIFGKDESKKYLKYTELIKNDPDITVLNQGTIIIKNRRFQYQKRYMLPYEYIKGIWNDKELLKKALNAGSDFYSNRQRRLIFTQINKQKNYHYKSNKQMIEEKEAEQIANELFKDGFFDEVI